MTIIGELAAFVCESSAARLPPNERELLTRHAADAVIAGIAGARAPEAAHLRALARGAPGIDAVAGAAAVIRHTEVDDIHLESCTTPSSVAVPVALLLALESGRFDPDIVAGAIRAGTDLMVRLGLAIDGPAALPRGVWPSAIGAPLCAAAVAARIRGLSQAQTENALSLALMMSAGRTGRFQGALSGRWVVFAAAVGDGLRAAHAARLGFCGDAALLDGAWFQNAQGMAFDTAKLMDGLHRGSVYPALSMKPFCTARQALGATQAMMELLDEGLDPDSVESISVRVPLSHAGMISQAVDPASRATGFVSAGFQMGLAAYRRDHLWDLDRAAVMSDARVLDFARKTRVAGDAELQREFPKRWPASIEVTASGHTLRRTVMTPKGDPSVPLDTAALADKARRLLEPLTGAEEAARLIGIARDGFRDAAACKSLCGTFAGMMGL